MTASRMLHRHIWQRLPRGLRQRAIAGATAALAPRARPEDARAKLPLIVAGFLTAATGLGQSARLSHTALREAGVPVMGVDLTDGMHQGANRVAYAFEDARRHTGAGTVLLHVNAPLVPLALLLLGRRVLRHKHIAGYWAWELPRVPAGWQAGAGFVHSVFVPSHFTRGAVCNVPVPGGVHVLPHPVAVGAECDAVRGRGNPFAVLTVFNAASSFARKNPIAAVDAFAAAFPREGRAVLTMKALNLDVFPVGRERLRRAAGLRSDIVIDERALPPSEWPRCSRAATRCCRSTARKVSVSLSPRACWLGSPCWQPIGPATPTSSMLKPACRCRSPSFRRTIHRALTTIPASAGPKPT